MTDETKQADWFEPEASANADAGAAEPAYDRELIARMLTEYNHGLIGQFSPVAVEHQIKLLREAENHSADGALTEEAK